MNAGPLSLRMCRGTLRMDNSESDWLLHLAALHEQNEYLTEQLCQRLIDVSHDFREYLLTQLVSSS
jgi:hypothetical protein